VLAGLLRQGPLSQAKLEVAWRATVGDAISRATTVRLHADGLVEVRAADQRWKQELKRSSKMILERLQNVVGRDQVLRLSISE